MTAPPVKQTKTLKQPIGHKLRLPHPYLTTYYIIPAENEAGDVSSFHIVQDEEEARSKPSPIKIDSDFVFNAPIPPAQSSVPPETDNTPWARAQKAPATKASWKADMAPSAGLIWLASYFSFVLQPDTEAFRLDLQGAGSPQLAESLVTSMLAIRHPEPVNKSAFTSKEIVVSRSAFWQGAGSPFGYQSPWTPSSRDTLNIEPADDVVTTGFPDQRIHARHPRRFPKPTPGSVVYSRYIPTLDEHYSLIALDHTNVEHVQYFHKWQNDPRVAVAWKQTGTYEEHRAYLEEQHDDPHQLTVLARFDDTIMSYFELYWAKEDTLGAYYDADDFDRGRHTLMGDSSYRGPHRVLAWWPCIIHYLFLDDHRTKNVVGEPAASNNTVVKYDFLHGLGIFKYVDFPHKRAVLVKVTREWFFQTCPLYQRGGFYNGTGVPLPSKL